LNVRRTRKAVVVARDTVAPRRGDRTGQAKHRTQTPAATARRASVLRIELPDTLAGYLSRTCNHGEGNPLVPRRANLLARDSLRRLRGTRRRDDDIEREEVYGRRRTAKEDRSAPARRH
jgi:hypothetical protein